MQKKRDIRDQSFVTGKDAAALNFINSSGKYVFKKYYRSGLRSHIFEVLSADDARKEIQGELVDGVRIFPRARPVKMLRILRGRFDSVADVQKEIDKYRLLLNWLGKNFIAASEEFITDYHLNNSRSIVLCGLQEYVDGLILDPWRMFDKDCFSDLVHALSFTGTSEKNLEKPAHKNLSEFIARVRKMIDATGFIPDLAGNGNLVMTRDGRIKLVDINNIVKIRLDKTIVIDDKGYPSCDVSVQVLSILEQTVLQKKIRPDDPLYGHFLDPSRQQKVKELEKKFYRDLNA